MKCIGCENEFFNKDGVCAHCGFPNYAIINQAIAESEANDGKYQKAKQTLTDAIELDPNNDSLYRDRSKIHICLNQANKAIEDMAKVR